KDYVYQVDTTFDKVNSVWVDNLHMVFHMTYQDRAIIQEIMRSHHRNSKNRFDEFDDYDISRKLGIGLFVVLLRLMPINGFYVFHEKEPRSSHHWLTVDSNSYSDVTEYYSDLINRIDLNSKRKVVALAKQIDELYIREINSNTSEDYDHS